MTELSTYTPLDIISAPKVEDALQSMATGEPVLLYLHRGITNSPKTYRVRIDHAEARHPDHGRTVHVAGVVEGENTNEGEPQRISWRYYKTAEGHRPSGFARWHWFGKVAVES